MSSSAPANSSVLPENWPELVTSMLRDYCHERRQHAQEMGPVANSWFAVLENFVCDGGKRIRPTFLWLGWLAGGGARYPELNTAIQKVAASLEFVQAGALIHDDIIDASDTRRGQPATHVHFTTEHQTLVTQGKATGESESFGHSAAILLGDIALTWADDMFLSAGLTAPALQRALPYWTSMRTAMLTGQYLDIHGETLPYCDAGNAWRVNRFKTAAYTIECPLQIGAACAGASAALLHGLSDYGVNLGIAFQLRDDLLGVFGDSATTGKPSGEDLREGKRTKLLADALNHLPNAEAEELWDLVGRSLSEAELERARHLLRTSDAVERSEAHIGELADTAAHALDTVVERGELAADIATELHHMVWRVTRRDY